MKTQLKIHAVEAQLHSNRRGLSENSSRTRQAGILSAILFLVVLVATGPLLGQTTSGQMTPQQKLIDAYTLEREAKPAQAIPELQALLDSKSLDARGDGKAWNILGLAYQDMGNFAYAQHAYEESIHIFEKQPDNIKDYAMALNDLGGFYVATGQLDPAARLRVKALHLYEKANDHAGIARSCSDLAGISFNRKKVRDGRKYLERAMQETRLTNDLDEDDLASIASMRGSLAQYDGDFGAAVASYQQSLDLWRNRHGEEHPFTGWGYALLGEAHAEAGDSAKGLAEMKQGLAILGRALNHQDPRYLTAEIAYSRVLDLTGAHAEAAQIKAGAETLLRASYSSQCSDCTISVAAFK